MTKSELNHVLTVDVNDFIELTSESFTRFAQSDQIHHHPSIFIEGRPGVGKSQSIQTIKESLAFETGKEVVITDIRLLLFNPVDLRGIPVVNDKRDAAIWLKPFIFNLNPSESHINLLFLDELTAAPTSIQAAAYQLVLDRKIGEHHLPQNTFVIAAGNGIHDEAISHAMPSALKNRFIHYRITENFKSWLGWATDKIHPFILDFLEKNPHEFVSKNLDTDSNIIITPRSWEILSMLLRGSDETKYEKIIASVVGTRLAAMMINEDSLEVDAIIRGTFKSIPEELSQIHLLCENIQHRIPQIIENETATINVLDFLNKIPIDYAVPVFRTIIQSPLQDYALESISGYQTFIQKIQSMDFDYDEPAI